MLAYLFWHRPRQGAPAEEYERALETFHRSLARRPPAGMSALACYRLAALPWQGRCRRAKRRTRSDPLRWKGRSARRSTRTGTWSTTTPRWAC